MTAADHDALRRDLGVYVLGALPPAERSRVEQHLADCAACRDEVAGLAALPPLLRRLPASEDEPVLPPVTTVVQRIAQHRRRDRWRQRLLTLTAVAALLLAAGVVAAPLVPQEPAGVRAFAGAEGAVATIEPRAWGMAVRIEADDLPKRRGYTAVAVADDGHRAQIASWRATGRAVVVEGACYLSPDEVDRVEIVAGDEEVVSVLRP